MIVWDKEDIAAGVHHVVEAGYHIVNVGRVTLAAGAAGGERMGAFGVVAVLGDGGSN